MIVHNALYTKGLRSDYGPLEKVYETRQQGGWFAWVDLYEPTEEEFDSVTREADLHPLALELAAKNNQWPKIKHYNETLFVVLKTVCYVEAIQRLEFGEIQVLLGADFAITVRRGEASQLHNMYQVQLAERDAAWLPQDPLVVLYTIVDGVVDGYSLVVAGLQNALEEIRTEVFSNATVLPQVNKLYHEALNLRMEAGSVSRILRRLAEEEGSPIVPEIHWYPRNVWSRMLRMAAHLEGFCDLLTSILRMNLASAGIKQRRRAGGLCS